MVVNSGTAAKPRRVGWREVVRKRWKLVMPTLPLLLLLMLLTISAVKDLVNVLRSLLLLLLLLLLVSVACAEVVAWLITR